MFAAEYGRIKTVRLLVEAGAGVGLKNGVGDTAADIARSIP